MLKNLLVLALGLCVLFMTACGSESSETPQIVEIPVTRIVEMPVTRVVEGSERVEVTRIVEVPVTRIVEEADIPIETEEEPAESIQSASQNPHILWCSKGGPWDDTINNIIATAFGEGIIIDRVENECLEQWNPEVYHGLIISRVTEDIDPRLLKSAPKQRILILINSNTENGPYQFDPFTEMPVIMRDELELSVAPEIYLFRGEEGEPVPGGNLFTFWEGLYIGVHDSYLRPTINNYLIPASSEWSVLSEIKGETSNKIRALAAIREYGNSEVLAVSLPGFVGSEDPWTLYGDQIISEFDNLEGMMRLIRWVASLTSVPGEPSSSAPTETAQVDEQYILQIESIQQQAANGEISREEAERQLDSIAAEIGKDSLAWVLRRMPTYNTETGQWESFDDFARGLTNSSAVSSGSARIDQDPVGTGVDLFVGDYEPSDIASWLGFDQ